MLQTVKEWLLMPSTYKGTALVASIFGLKIPETAIEMFCQGVIAVIGSWAIYRKDPSRIKLVDTSKPKQ
jgi:hypothetical protein